MKTEQALQKLTEVLQRKHVALKTQQCYCAWLKRYCEYVKKLPALLPSEQKLERFLTALAKNDVAASTQNQALNAVQVRGPAQSSNSALPVSCSSAGSSAGAQMSSGISRSHLSSRFA